MKKVSCTEWLKNSACLATKSISKCRPGIPLPGRVLRAVSCREAVFYLQSNELQACTSESRRGRHSHAVAGASLWPSTACAFCIGHHGKPPLVVPPLCYSPLLTPPSQLNIALPIVGSTVDLAQIQPPARKPTIEDIQAEINAAVELANQLHDALGGQHHIYSYSGPLAIGWGDCWGTWSMGGCQPLPLCKHLFTLPRLVP